MSEQWFLDLDGVRSGPYQTSEVMSLVAEGEILPHHQIAMDLKSQKWMTILEWRLNQNRSTEPKKETPPQVAPSFIPAQEKAPHPEKSFEKPVEKPITPPADEPIEIARVVQIPNPAEPPKIIEPVLTGPKPKRDPMAEMFDMLQNTKQKRETKSQQSHAQAHAQTQANHTPAPAANHDPAKPAMDQSNWGKTILFGAVITILGFALGQFFQHQGQKPAEPAPIVKETATPSSATETTNTVVIENDGQGHSEVLEVRERNTDKMTIRARVPVNNNAAVSPTPEHGKDIQELKDLKKELMELKALKDEIRNNGTGDNNGQVNAPGPEKVETFDGDPNEAPPVDHNGNPIAPEEGGDVHY